MRLADPLLGCIALAVVAAVWELGRYRSARGATLRFSDLSTMKGSSPHAWRRRRSLGLFRLGTLVLLAIAVARPQSEKRLDEIVTEGIDIMLALDISGSMKAEDFKPKNRVTVAKQVVANFVKGLHNDRVGLVVFSAQSFTQCPLTLDYGVLLNFLSKVDIGLIEDGTAIGNALATCVDRLKDSSAKSKVVVLLTDGENNAGMIDPLTAAQAAQAFDIRIYTIGVGKPEGTPMVYDDPIWGRQYRRDAYGNLLLVKVDERSLKEISSATNGKYFLATDKSALEKIYREIWRMEKTRFKTKEYQKYRELFPAFLLPALLLLAGEFILSQTLWLKLP
ncbi:MAG: hypothetical protein AUJ92_04585 [Armatimonadetes bacterium CG2_30_59_28]|nr:VWA domain-containing protein [Armatimonadota bacterium]OIO97004.1 MAG: hypothetical protein AUJ92_04585 [Armatimonadetes bacterium CG2_30_59_28]PIU64241.1 MAG: aerotolerance regulator BatA [Armatimonadetes bacterium CG07_land_8_20_14_0_80_59_28]PIX43319.1 MAG: aerotolerance regulator BatA [Armatimonadetes bacterium CG_4_8_14_3_um_filter_58_9]